MNTPTELMDGRDDAPLMKDVILIVDDSTVDRASYRRYLEASQILGCHILDCDSAEAALQICLQDCPDVILLDYLLPDADGIEFLRDLAAQMEILPSVVMLTGQGSEVVAVEAMKHGARDYLVKGQLTAQKLVNVVVNALTERQLQVQLQATLANQRVVEQQLRDRVIEIEQTNLRLSQATRLLKIRNQELDEFSCIVSHDLQAPLRGIANLAGWLVRDLEGQLSIENQQQLELIQSRVLQMSFLINGLLEYARVGKENIRSTRINISQLITEVVDLLVPPAEFQISFSPHLPMIETQALLLKQVLSNLIGNAIQYHQGGIGKVEIVVKDQESLLHFMVIDDGPGIAKKNHQKIFGIFQTLVGRDEMKSTGIGLAIVKKIVESRGGSVWLESEIGKGSVFSFTWPLLS